MAANNDDWLETQYAVAIYCGLRQGELLALVWEELDTSWFCPYRCATVDTPLFTLRGGGSTTHDPIARRLDYRRPPLVFGDVSRRNHEGRCVGCVVSPTSSKVCTRSLLIEDRPSLLLDNQLPDVQPSDL